MIMFVVTLLLLICRPPVEEAEQYLDISEINRLRRVSPIPPSSNLM